MPGAVQWIERESERSRRKKRLHAGKGHSPRYRVRVTQPTREEREAICDGSIRPVQLHDSFLYTLPAFFDAEEFDPQPERCVHPLVTLFDKLDAMARRYARDVIDADAFVRHYEDAAQIVRAAKDLPDAGMTAAEAVGSSKTRSYFSRSCATVIASRASKRSYSSLIVTRACVRASARACMRSSVPRAR